MSKASGITLFNSGLLTAQIGNPVRLNVGMQGVIVCSGNTNLAPTEHQVSVNLMMPGNGQGTSFIVVNTSKVISAQSIVGPLYFPAGDYIVKSVAGSTVPNCYIGIFPTL